MPVIDIDAVTTIVAAVERDVLLATKNGHAERTPIERWRVGIAAMLDQMGVEVVSETELRRLREVERAARALVDESPFVDEDRYGLCCAFCGRRPVDKHVSEHSDACPFDALTNALADDAGKGE